MGMFGNFFGGEKPGKGRENLGADSMAIPDKAPGDTTNNEAAILESKRERKEKLEALVVEIESNPNHPQKESLDMFRDQLRSML